MNPIIRMQEKYNVLLLPILGLQDTTKIFLDNHISARNQQILICLQYIYMQGTTKIINITL